MNHVATIVLEIDAPTCESARITLDEITHYAESLGCTVTARRSGVDDDPEWPEWHPQGPNPVDM
jgi:hypothetical protein